MNWWKETKGWWKWFVKGRRKWGAVLSTRQDKTLLWGEETKPDEIEFYAVTETMDSETWSRDLVQDICSDTKVRNTHWHGEIRWRDSNTVIRSSEKRLNKDTRNLYKQPRPIPQRFYKFVIGLFGIVVTVRIETGTFWISR